MNKDTVVGILGAVILVAAMVGIFYYEGTQAPGGIATSGGTGPLALTWRTVTAAGPGDSGNLAAGASQDGEANVSATNLTAVTFSLTWTDAGNNANFILEVTSPDGTTLTDESNDGTAEVVFRPINAAPTAQRGSATDLAGWQTTNGTGAWTYTVTLVSDGPDPPAPGLPPPPIAPPVGGDAGNDWALAVELESYAADATTA